MQICRRIAPLLGSIVVAGMMLVGAAKASDAVAPPEAAQIEQLLRQALKADAISRGPSLSSFDNATLLDFELREVERIASDRVDAMVDLKLDFGPPPAGVLGYKRERSGSYELELQHDGEDWELQRLTPLADLQKMPG